MVKMNGSEAMRQIISDLDLINVPDEILDSIGGHSSSESAKSASPTPRSTSSFALLNRNSDALSESEISADSPSSQVSHVLTPMSAGSSR